MTWAEVEPIWWVALFALLELGLLVGALGYALMRASSLAPPSLLVIAMSLLTLLGLVTYVLTRENDILALLGVLLGALAAATAADYNVRTEHTPPDPPPDNDHVDEEG